VKNKQNTQKWIWNRNGIREITEIENKNNHDTIKLA